MKMLKHLFGKRDKELDVLQEEALQSPLRTVVRNFGYFPDRTDRTGL